MNSFAPEHIINDEVFSSPTQVLVPVYKPAKTLLLEPLPVYDARYVAQHTTASLLRSSLYIPSEMSTRSSNIFGRYYSEHKSWLRAFGMAGVLAVLIGVFLVANPLTSGNINPFQIFHVSDNLVQVNDPSSIALTAQQKAIIATVTKDGYESSTQQHVYVGLPSAPVSTITSAGSTLNRFTYGQCTYWAAERYHALSGYWPVWFGDAYAWRAGAASAGWVVSSVPQVPSIIVLQPGVQGAGWYGHVAVVEKVNSDGTVLTSNWNWYQNGGGWARLSYVTFHPGSGVSFVWHP